MPVLSILAEAFLTHAQLSRAAWAVIAAFAEDPYPTFALLAALDALRTAQRQTAIRCTCHTAGSQKEWCTGHCTHPTEEVA